MTIRQRLAWRYGVTVGISMLFLGGQAYHEFVTEPAERRRHGIAEPPESEWSEFVEVAAYGAIPLLLGIGWWAMRRTLAPLDGLVQHLKDIRTQTDLKRLPRVQNGDEVDSLAQAFNELLARLDETLQQNRLFTLHASHELKTPLTVMWLQLETLLQSRASLTEEQRESLECQMNEVQRLGRTVDALTLLAKADAGQVRLERKPVELAELVREGFEDGRVLAELSQVRVSLGLCDDVLLAGDRDRLRQLVLNLVDNAIKYNVPGGEVRLSLRQEEDHAELEVANTGQTIPPELRRRLFQRFVRGEEARSRAIEGSGLGLSICQWIVQAHGGAIEVASEPGQLTRFIVRWPTLVREPAALI